MSAKPVSKTSESIDMSHPMKLWLLRPVEEWDLRWDIINGAIVRAASESDARALLDAAQLDEGGDVLGDGNRAQHPWLDAALTTCVELTLVGEATIVLLDTAKEIR